MRCYLQKDVLGQAYGDVVGWLVVRKLEVKVNILSTSKKSMNLRSLEDQLIVCISCSPKATPETTTGPASL